MQKPLEFTISVADFITYLLPEESSKVGTAKFKMAVVNFYARQFAPLGGETIVGIDDENRVSEIESWTTGFGMGFMVDVGDGEGGVSVVSHEGN